MSLFRIILLSGLIARAFGAPPDDLDRQRLIAHFEMTDSWLADEVSHLSPAQLAFRPSATSWNVLDCVEHLVLSEREYWATFKTSMAARPVKGESPSDDVDRLWYGIDRTQRTKTIESETPKSRYAGVEPALRDFQTLRATMVAYARTSQEDWRHHLIPGWDRDAYQWLIMISAHSQRHILQIREIKHNPAFPST
jgi:DinB superfamily